MGEVCLSRGVGCHPAKVSQHCQWCDAELRLPETSHVPTQMRGFVLVGSVLPPQLLPSHLVRSTWYSSAAIVLLLVLTVISVCPRFHPLSVTCRINSECNRQPANEKSKKKGTRNKKETGSQRKPGPKTHFIHSSNEVSSTHIWSRLQSVVMVPFTVGADSPKSCPPRSYHRPGLTRRCSLSHYHFAHTFVPD